MNEVTNRTPGGPGAGGTRAILLAAAIRCVRNKGMARTTSREIAREAGTNLQSITYHFGSKENLISEALLETIRVWVDPALVALQSDAPPPMRLLGALQALQDSFEKAHDVLPVYLDTLVQAPRSDLLRERVRALMEELRGFLVVQMKEMKATGFLPAWIDPSAMATLLLAAADGVALHSAIAPESVDHHAVSGQALQLLLAAAQNNAAQS